MEWSGKNSPQKVIILTSEDGNLEGRYIFVGEPLIQNGQRVEKGEIIARAGQEVLPTRDVSLIIQATKENRRMSLDL